MSVFWNCGVETETRVQNCPSGRWFLQIAPPWGRSTWQVNLRMLHSLHVESPCVDTRKSPFYQQKTATFILPTVYFKEHLRTSMRYFLFFPYFFLSVCPWEVLLLCKCRVWTPWTGFIVWSSLSPVCNIPACVLDNGMDGSQITLAEPQTNKRRQPHTLEGKVVCGCAVVSLNNWFI